MISIKNYFNLELSRAAQWLDNCFRGDWRGIPGPQCVAEERLVLLFCVSWRCLIAVEDKLLVRCHVLHVL